MNFKTLDERFDNWGMTVRSPKFQAGVCAQWAKQYVAIRDSKNVPSVITPVERDGWLVEAAWREMPNHVHKWVLKYTYVLRLSPEQVAIRMRRSHGAVLRGVKFDAVVADAEISLSRSIARISSQQFLKNIPQRACKPETAVL